MLAAAPMFAKSNGHGKGYMGGSNTTFVQGSEQQLYNGYGDGSMPHPMDGTGFGASQNIRGQAQGQMLQDGTCINQDIYQNLD